MKIQHRSRVLSHFVVKSLAALVFGAFVLSPAAQADPAKRDATTLGVTGAHAPVSILRHRNPERDRDRDRGHNRDRDRDRNRTRVSISIGGVGQPARLHRRRINQVIILPGYGYGYPGYGYPGYGYGGGYNGGSDGNVVVIENGTTIINNPGAYPPYYDAYYGSPYYGYPAGYGAPGYGYPANYGAPYGGNPYGYNNGYPVGYNSGLPVDGYYNGNVGAGNSYYYDPYGEFDNFYGGEYVSWNRDPNAPQFANSSTVARATQNQRPGQPGNGVANGPANAPQWAGGAVWGANADGTVATIPTWPSDATTQSTRSSATK